jgi:hypothetical protein
VRHVGSIEIRRAQRNRISVAEIAAQGGVGTWKAGKDVFEAAVFLNDDDDVLDERA